MTADEVLEFIRSKRERQERISVAQMLKLVIVAIVDINERVKKLEGK